MGGLGGGLLVEAVCELEEEGEEEEEDDIAMGDSNWGKDGAVTCCDSGMASSAGRSARCH